jgi:hypothetical protein
VDYERDSIGELRDSQLGRVSEARGKCADILLRAGEYASRLEEMVVGDDQGIAIEQRSAIGRKASAAIEAGEARGLGALGRIETHRDGHTVRRALRLGGDLAAVINPGGLSDIPAGGNQAVQESSAIHRVPEEGAGALTPARDDEADHLACIVQSQWTQALPAGRNRDNGLVAAGNVKEERFLGEVPRLTGAQNKTGAVDGDGR